jgi:hypothetical protein
MSPIVKELRIYMTDEILMYTLEYDELLVSLIAIKYEEPMDAILRSYDPVLCEPAFYSSFFVDM